MSLYGKILKTFILPLSEFVFSIPLSKEIQNLDKLTKASDAIINETQTKKIENLLKHTTKNSEYYKNLNLKLDSKNPIENLKMFPILTKSILKEYTDQLLTQPKKNLLKNGSSGSTGEQTIVYWSKKEQTINRATQLLWWQWGNYRIGDRLIQTGITPNRQGLKRYKDLFFRTKYIQAFSHNSEEIASFLKSLDPKREYVLAGYASSLFVFATIAKEKNINVKIKSAIAWGDKLFDHYKSAIQDTFGCKTYETYGSAEGLMIGAQQDLDYLYIMSSNVFVEIVDENGEEVQDGTLGNVVVTNLNGFAMPLIRYKIGDLAIKLPQEKYPSHRNLNLPVFEKIIGRDTDIVKTPLGNYMIVHSFTGIFEHIPEIKQFCVVQNNLFGITILYIKGSNFMPEILSAISQKIQDHLNEPFTIKFEEVQNINATGSGKPQLIVSNLKK